MMQTLYECTVCGCRIVPARENDDHPLLRGLR